MPLYKTGTIAITTGGVATGTGTAWTTALNGLRVGQTILVNTNPQQQFTISAINSATSMRVTPSPTAAISATSYGILITDALTVDGLGSMVAEAVQYFKTSLSGRAASGANGDITSLTGLQTALSVAQGGTGGKTQADARKGIGLGTAAVADTMTQSDDATGGRVMTVGAFGIGATTAPTSPTDMFALNRCGMYAAPGAAGMNYFDQYAPVLAMVRYENIVSYLQISPSNGRAAVRGQSGGKMTAWNELYTTGNTTRSSDGTLKAASPIARIVKSQAFSSRADIAESGFEWCGCGTANEEARGVSVRREDTGIYIVTGSLGLASEGWRMMPPRDPDGSGDLGIVEAEEDENHVITLRLYRRKYMLSDDGEMVLTKGNLIDVPANSWIDIRLDMPDNDVQAEPDSAA